PMVIRKPATMKPYISVIQSNSAAPGCRSTMSLGTASIKTVKSMAYTKHGKARTARPIHSRCVALFEEPIVINLPISKKVKPGAGDGGRTRDFQLRKLTLYH